MPEEPSTTSPVPSGLVAELAAAGFEGAREVARGGAGVIYLCSEAALGRYVAVKVLPSHFDEESQERFLREGYAMGSLSGHPNIVNVLRVGVTASNRPYIVMPYHAEDSLEVKLQREDALSWPEVLRIGVKVCGALQTAHNAGTLHRDIKPANILLNDYGEPQLTDFGIAHVAGGFKTATGFFSGTIDYTAPEVMTGNPASVLSDIYSLGATLYALAAGNAAHERKSGEDLITQYLRISSTGVPDLRAEGIPDALCAAIERAMAINPANRPASAAALGRELQAAQRRNGLKPDSMAITGAKVATGRTVTIPRDATGAPSVQPGATPPPPAIPTPPPANADPPGTSAAIDAAGAPRQTTLPSGYTAWLGNRDSQTEPKMPARPSPAGQPGEAKPPTPAPARKRNRLLLIGAAVAVLLLVAGGIFFLLPEKKDDKSALTPPSAQAQARWKPITNARIQRDGAATTQSDGTIWIFGGVRSDGAATANHEGYDPEIDEWKGGDNLPVAVQHADAVTWQGNPVVMGGWKTEAGKNVATDQVWRVVNSRWVELPHLLQPRAAAAAVVIGDRIIITGGVDASGALLNTTEIFDGAAWTLGVPLPTPRKLLDAASDGKLMYTVGGTDGNADLPTVEAYDPVAKTWTPMAALPQPRSDHGVTIIDSRLVVVGGVSSGQVLNKVSLFDLVTKHYDTLPDSATARHGMAVAAIHDTVYAIGGSTAVGNKEVVSTAESLKLPARQLQPAAQWRSLPDAPTPRLMMAWTVLDNKIWLMAGLRNGTVLATVESYDPRAGVWQTGPPLPVALHHAAAATYRGEVVVLGGASDDIANASNRVFALRGNGWVELPPLKHNRAAPAAAVIGDKLVVVGGRNAKNLVPQTEVYDGDSWTDATDMPTPREHLAAVSDGTAMYTVGGRFLSADKNSAAFERFDPQSGTWMGLVGMPTPRGNYGATYIGGRVLAVGGEEPTRVLAVVEAYDIAQGKWSTLPPMPTARHGDAVATVDNTIYVIGGANRPSYEGGTATVEALDFS